MTADEIQTWLGTDAMRSTVSVDESNAAFEGHFPGNPAFPGVGQLWLAQTVAEAHWSDIVPVGMRKVRFRAPVQPNTSLAFEISPSGEHEVRIEIRDAGREDRAIITDCVMLVAPEAPTAPSTDASVPDAAAPTQVSADRILPQTGPARFYEAAIVVADAESDDSWVRGRVPADNFLVRDGRAPVFAALEFAAQAGPALQELRKPDPDDVCQLAGLFAGVKQAQFFAPSFDVEDELIAALTSSTRGGFMTVHARVFTRNEHGVRPIATCELKLLVKAA